MWLDEDRSYALAWQAEDADRCSGCGHPMTETLDPANEEAYVGHAVVCHSCRAIEVKTQTVDQREGLRGYSTREDG